MDSIHMAEGLNFSMASLSQQDSHMGQSQEKEFLWTIYLSQLQKGRGINITSYANLSAREEIVGKSYIPLSEGRESDWGHQRDSPHLAARSISNQTLKYTMATHTRITNVEYLEGEKQKDI